MSQDRPIRRDLTFVVCSLTLCNCFKRQQTEMKKVRDVLVTVKGSFIAAFECKLKLEGRK
jgi:hypothetical protein